MIHENICSRQEARIGEITNEFRIWLERLKMKDHSEEIGVDERIILKMCGVVFLEIHIHLKCTLRHTTGRSLLQY
jgi:hypothetical protein